MRKFPVLLLLILCLVLFACTESKNVDSAQSASTSPKESNAMTEPAQSTTSEAAVDVTARVVVNGTINTFTGYATDSTYYFQKTDIQAALGDADFTNAQIVQKNSIDYYSLRDLCTNMNYLFTHDEVLGAEYIWTYPDAMQQISSNDEINRAISRGIGEVRADDSVVTYSEFFTMLDRVVELADPDKLADWQAQFPQARASSDRMTRYDGMKAVLKCAVTLGGNYLTFSIDWLPLNDKIGEKVWDEIGRITDPDRYIPNDFPYQGGGFENEDFSEWDDCGVAYRYSFGKVSLASNHSLFDYDEAENSMLPDRAFTYNAAILASIRLLESESAESDIIALTDPNAVTCDSTIITDTLLDRANARPVMTQEKQSALRGLVFGWDYNFVGMPVTDAELRNAANWGFNSARVMLTYQTLFDQDANTVNAAQLRQLDRLVAAAMKYNLHLNIVTFSMPGRWARFNSTAFTSTGDFDLFTNAKKQKQAAAIWAMLSERYKDVPSSALSFSPLWETFNTNLSTGLPVKSYTDTDVANVFDLLVGTIREHDADRFVIYESTAGNLVDDIIRDSSRIQSTLESKYSNVVMMTNFCEGPFVYANMTMESGEHIDHNNHSIYLQDYPATIYDAQSHFQDGQSMEMTGELVSGTKIDIYLKKVNGAGDFEILADGAVIYTETLSSKQYETSYPLSGLYPFATSDKLISVTLDADVEKLEIRYMGKDFEWSGIDVTLPEQYAVERWWVQTNYDAMLQGLEEPEPPSLQKTSVIMLCPNSWDSGRQIIINSDVTYTSESIMAQANQETVDAWAKAISEFAPHSVVRIENANFNSCSLDAALAYYNDVHAALEKYGLGWYSNDYINFSNAGRRYVGFTPVTYQGGSYCIELLQELQKWQ